MSARPRRTPPSPPPVEDAPHPERWWTLLGHHHDAADRHARTVAAGKPRELGVIIGVGIISAILALVNVQRGQYLEMRRIRKILEAGRITAINLTAKPTPKEGS